MLFPRCTAPSSRSRTLRQQANPIRPDGETGAFSALHGTVEPKPHAPKQATPDKTRRRNRCFFPHCTAPLNRSRTLRNRQYPLRPGGEESSFHLFLRCRRRLRNGNLQIADSQHLCSVQAAIHPPPLQRPFPKSTIFRTGRTESPVCFGMRPRPRIAALQSRAGRDLFAAGGPARRGCVPQAAAASAFGKERARSCGSAPRRKRTSLRLSADRHLRTAENRERRGRRMGAAANRRHYPAGNAAHSSEAARTVPSCAS